LALARNKRAGFDVRQSGLFGASRRLTLYGSAETHAWVIKGAELLGLGRDSYRPVPVDSEYRIDAAALRELIAKDRALGLHPLCVIGNAGTVNIGATDDLRTLAQICREEDLWLHTDGAFGALAQWSERLRPVVAGLAEADSLAFDLHKWMYQPFTVACLLVRDGSALRSSFATEASYLAPPTDRGVYAGGLRFADQGIELTREFRALKVWMSLKTHGVRAITRVIEQNVDQARTLAALVNQHPDLELLAPVPLNVVCFRYAPLLGMSDCFWNLVNQEVLIRLQESGIAVPSSTMLRGRFAIRCIFVNHRTRSADIRLLADSVVRFGREVLREMN
jgi:glutamate/tyrosine decarboxylase-like PLP-dependent enzyme